VKRVNVFVAIYPPDLYVSAYICKLKNVLGVSMNSVEFSSTFLLWLFIEWYYSEKRKEGDT